jgi:ornithine cyclodeaminase/alanine dehydrogenase-like protein (mu-crystallin family)
LTLLLSRDEVRDLVTLEDAVELLDALARDEAAGRNVHMPTFGGAHAGAGGLLRTVGGAALGAGVAGLRSGGIALVHETARGGGLLAVMAYGFSRLRVAASVALGARYVARPDCRVVGVLGAGPLALESLRGLCAELPIESASVYSPTPEHRASVAARASDQLGIPIAAVDSMAAAIVDVDVIAMATSAYYPVLTAEHLRPGVFIAGVGAAPEIDAPVYLAVDQFATFSRQQELTYHAPKPERPNQAESGLHLLLRTGQLAEESIANVGSIALGDVQARHGPEAVTLYRDPQGGASDIALANLAYQRAKERGRGTEFDFGRQDP